jgi:hypothetical protein
MTRRGDKIVSIPIIKMGNQDMPDKIVWPLTQNGDYQVKSTYEVLLQDSRKPETNSRANGILMKAWKDIWRVELPRKIITFYWKIIHDAYLSRLSLLRWEFNVRMVEFSAIQSRKQ